MSIAMHERMRVGNTRERRCDEPIDGIRTIEGERSRKSNVAYDDVGDFGWHLLKSELTITETISLVYVPSDDSSILKQVHPRAARHHWRQCSNRHAKVSACRE